MHYPKAYVLEVRLGDGSTPNIDALAWSAAGPTTLDVLTCDEHYRPTQTVRFDQVETFEIMAEYNIA